MKKRASFQLMLH